MSENLIHDNELLLHLTEEYGLPLHLIIEQTFTENVNAFREVANRLYPQTQIGFAVKSNPCRGAVRMAARHSLGADVVSQWELQCAYEEAISPTKIICNGNAKTLEYITEAVTARAIIAVDNLDELQTINRVAESLNRNIGVLLRFSQMPLDNYTVPDQSTAAKWTKFGISVLEAGSAFNMCKQLEHIDMMGISAHIGTQICSPLAYDKLMDSLIALAGMAINEGFSVRYLDMGGGFPVNYLSEGKWNVFKLKLLRQIQGGAQTDEWVTWGNLPLGYEHLMQKQPLVSQGLDSSSEVPWLGKSFWSKYPGSAMLEHALSRQSDAGITIANQLEALGNPTLIIEPGRALISEAGVTLAKVIGIKKVQGLPVVTIDLGIVNHGTNLVTPDIFPVHVLPAKSSDEPADVFLAGRLCFSGDMLSKIRIEVNRLPEPGELIAIRYTGAYSADHFASNSCGFARPAKVAILADGTRQVWRPADTFKDVWAYI